MSQTLVNFQIFMHLNFSTPIRPPSPTFEPKSEIDKKVSPKLSLQKKPSYKSKLHTRPYGVEQQLAVYKSPEDKDRKSREHLRVGKASFLIAHDSILSQVGKKSLFDVYGIQAQFAM